jgi:hypothetical protein
MGSVYHGPTETPLHISEQLRLQISALFEEFLSRDGKALDYCAMKSSEAFASYVRLASHLQVFRTHCCCRLVCLWVVKPASGCICRSE